MTTDEFRQLPGGPPYFQLVGGELFMSPSPRYRHQRIVGHLFAAIYNYLAANPIGEVIVAPSDVELGNEDVYEPDIYFISNERLGIVTEQGVTGAPDLVIEVLSPSTARLDYRKRDKYGATGVKEMWLVSERGKKIEIYTSSGSELTRARTLGPDDAIETQLLPGFRLEARRVLEP
ncbi:MAG TPA: Uma2 family endonuclease [Chthoniobacterales bacterium]|jgi:Uma2 family endonuclease